MVDCSKHRRYKASYGSTIKLNLHHRMIVEYRSPGGGDTNAAWKLHMLFSIRSYLLKQPSIVIRSPGNARRSIIVRGSDPRTACLTEWTRSWAADRPLYDSEARDSSMKNV